MAKEERKRRWKRKIGFGNRKINWQKRGKKKNTKWNGNGTGIVIMIGIVIVIVTVCNEMERKGIEVKRKTWLFDTTKEGREGTEGEGRHGRGRVGQC